MGMTIDEFDEYAKSHNILIMTRELYENRLKADMVAMLEEIKSNIEGTAIIELDSTFAEGEKFCADIIQQKIDVLKGEGKK